MTPRVFWKLLATVLLMLYAVSALLPLTTRDFAEFAAGEVSADQPGFDALLSQARERVKNHAERKAGAPAAPTVYQAVRDIVNDPAAPVDLHAKFYPKLDLIPEPNVQKRNLMVLRHLLQRSQGKLKLGLDLQGGVAFTLKVPEEAFKGRDAGVRANQMEKAAKVMSDRINQYGVAEPIIRTVGSDTLEIQLPGNDMANNPDAIDALKKPAKLEFRMVHRFERPKPGAPEFSSAVLREDPTDIASPVETYEVLYQRETNARTGAVTEFSYYVKKAAAATGNIIDKSYPQSGDGVNWHVSINFNKAGEKAFGDITGEIAAENLRYRAQDPGRSGISNGRMAIVLDGKLVSAPGLKEDKAITGGAASIEADDHAKAWELASVLNNPLEFPLQLQDVQTVGPSLAEEAKSKSVLAAGVGVGLVVLFMIAYYLSAGVIAIGALVVNVVAILGIMAAMGATITLPGVAALVLTMGMAVDANILIFERIREEINAGKNLRHALSEGYARALATILDANITTLMTAGILIWLGTGPIRGFGITLAIGIVTTVFTALITARGVQELCVNLGVFTRIFGLGVLAKNAQYKFMDHARKAFTAGWVIILLGLVAIAVRGRESLGKDFKGGEAVTVAVAQGKKLDPSEVEFVAKAAGIKDVTSSYLTDITGQKTTLRLECEHTPAGAPEFAHATAVVKALVAKHADYFPAGAAAESLIQGRESVGATVSGSLQLNAVLSVVFALLGILIYVALRFEIGFGVAAMVATLHDVLMTCGLYVVYGWVFGGAQVTASMVAAILMIIGYSINDTIVVFDRIREEMELNPRMSLRDVIHLSINRTLSRTVLTALTVFLTAVALYVFGAGDVKEYGLVFVFGVLTGTFSSIFIAAPVFYWWHKGSRDSVEKSDAGEKREWEKNTDLKKLAPVDKA